MEIQIHNGFNAPLINGWDTLLNSAITNVPFLQPGYLERWWQYKGGGEWPAESKLMLFSGWDAKKLKGIAPFFLIHEVENQLSLHLLGSEEISDYLDFITEPQDIYPFMRSLLAYLKMDAPASIQTISLVNIPQDSPSLRALEENAHDFGWHHHSVKAYHTPIIRLPEDWEEYLAGIDKKQRHEIRRKVRRAYDEAKTIKLRFVDHDSDISQEMEDFLRLMEQDEKKKEFLTPLMRDQMRAIISWAHKEGYLQLSFLEINGENAAGYCCFDYNQHIYVYNSGFDARFSTFSPGWVLLSFLIQHAIEQKKKFFDFMRGDETYKYRFGAVDSYVMRVILKRAKV